VNQESRQRLATAQDCTQIFFPLAGREPASPRLVPAAAANWWKGEADAREIYDVPGVFLRFSFFLGFSSDACVD